MDRQQKTWSVTCTMSRFACMRPELKRASSPSRRSMFARLASPTPTMRMDSGRDDARTMAAAAEWGHGIRSTR